MLELLLVSTVPMMFLAADGLPNLWLVTATVLGGAGSAGAAAAFNMYIERHSDALMQRTRNRPLVTGEITPRNALVFSWCLAVLSVLWLLTTTNWLAAVLAAAAIVFYVVIYTLILKPRTEQNIVWGGIAGCFPPMIGWAAITGGLDWTPLLAFLLIFFWTPAHYWPLSIKYADDYRAAGTPMLGVTREQSHVATQILIYTVATLATSLALIVVADLKAVTATLIVALGIAFTATAARLVRTIRRGTPSNPMTVFHFSIAYLGGIFVLLGIDPFLSGL